MFKKLSKIVLCGAIALSVTACASVVTPVQSVDGVNSASKQVAYSVFKQRHRKLMIQLDNTTDQDKQCNVVVSNGTEYTVSLAPHSVSDWKKVTDPNATYSFTC